MSRKSRRCSGVASLSRGNHSMGTSTLRPSSSATRITPFANSTDFANGFSGANTSVVCHRHGAQPILHYPAPLSTCTCGGSSPSFLKKSTRDPARRSTVGTCGHRPWSPEVAQNPPRNRVPANHDLAHRLRPQGPRKRRRHPRRPHRHRNRRAPRRSLRRHVARARACDTTLHSDCEHDTEVDGLAPSLPTRTGRQTGVEALAVDAYSEAAPKP